MKNLIMAMFLIVNISFASEPTCTEQVGQVEEKEKLELTTDVPKYLKGATITVTKADGSSSTVPAERFKVVPRKQQFIVTKTEVSKTISCSAEENRKNRVSLLGGYGSRNGLTTTRNATNVTVESSSGVVGGAQYQRMLNNRWSLGVQGQTNGTGSLLLGLDF